MERGFQLELPIVALSTAIGQSAIAILKLSGKNLVTKIFPFFSVSNQLLLNPCKMIHGFFLDSHGNALDEIMMVVFPEPASYTGEDVIEIFLHGNMNISQDIIKVLLSADFQLALPGEFTYRAVMNGKLDLIKAEAVHELVTSKSSLGCRLSLKRLSGELTTYCEMIYNRLVEIASWLRMHLDYPQEEIEELPQFVFSDISEQLRILISNSKNMKRWQEGAKIALVGAPNVGKSSLFNLLLGYKRALVSEIAGTTRDYLEEDIELLGHPIRIIDTAGIRKSHDIIEKMGINLGLSLLEEADLILCLLDQDNQQILQDIVPYKDKVFLVMNKSDLGHMGLPEDVMAISVLKRHNIDELIQKIVERLNFPHIEEDRHSLMLGSLRQQQICEKAYQHILKAQQNQVNADLDIMSYYLQQAINNMAEFLGKMTNADINNAMFGRFCLGK